jgi:histidyl-tRNA synthetase
MNQQTQPPKGFRDFLPNEKRKRDFVTAKVKEVFEKFGFEPLETPTLEYADILLGKYGKEADKLVYTFEDRGGRSLGLRYDQTVPTARVLAEYAFQIPTGFRRYQIQNVFRADKPQKGRFREFTQCDIDIFGSTSPLADAEILSCTYLAYKNVGFPNVKLKINDRQTLIGNNKQFETETINVFSIIQSIDKLDKQSEEEIIKELVSKGLSNENAKKCIELLSQTKLTDNLSQIIDAAIKLGIPKEKIIFDPKLARGLDYYTGMIFEVSVPEYGPNSLGGGGRYDNLIKSLGGPDTPAVGIAFGFDRMVEAADELKLIPNKNLGTKILVTIFSQDLQNNSLEITRALREKNIPTEIYPDENARLDKQLKYADRKGIPFAIIIGPEEAEKKTFTLKNLVNKSQKSYSSLEELIEEVKQN